MKEQLRDEKTNLYRPAKEQKKQTLKK